MLGNFSSVPVLTQRTEAWMSGTRKPGQPAEDPVDEAVEETFPASDPPAFGGTTGPDDPPPNAGDAAI